MYNSFRNLNYLTVGAALCLQFFGQTTARAQYTVAKGNDSNTPLHQLKPAYETPYGLPKPAEVKGVLDRIYIYLDAVTPASLQDKNSNATVTDLTKADANSIFSPGDFRLISYEWGVTYTGMLEAGAATGDKKFTDYTVKRIGLINEVANHYRTYLKTNPKASTPVGSVLRPRSLDDAGAMAAAMIKTEYAGQVKSDLRPVIDNYVNYIMTEQYRLKDGTLARNLPLPNTLWLDDMYMGLPALAQMGVLTGDKKYFEEALKQFKLFSGRMFNHERGLYMHGWIQGMEPHPEFHWARANGWGLLTTVELLDALPENYPGRESVLDLLHEHIAGLARLQDKTGFWHQLLDKNDSYLETSATAIYDYCIARAINKGWLDGKAYGPMALLAWNAVSTKVNDKGQVEGTCVGTAMAFDPAYYYYRPVNVFAAHGYGPTLLAGAEIYRLLEKHSFIVSDNAIQLTK